MKISILSSGCLILALSAIITTTQAQSLRATGNNRILDVIPEEEGNKGPVGNAVVGGATAAATGGNVAAGAVGGVVGGAIAQNHPVAGAAIGGAIAGGGRRQ